MTKSIITPYTESVDDLLKAAYEHEERGDRYTSDSQRSYRHYEKALHYYTLAYNRDPQDPDTLYNMARLHLVLVDRLDEPPEKFFHLSTAVEISVQCQKKMNEVGEEAHLADILFNYAQGLLWRAQLVLEYPELGVVESLGKDIVAAIQSLERVVWIQRKILEGGDDQESEKIEVEPDEMPCDAYVTEASPVTWEAVLDALLLQIECMEFVLESRLADVVFSDVQFDQIIQLAHEVAAKAQLQLSSKTGPKVLDLTTQGGSAKGSPQCQALLAEARLIRARGDHAASVLNQIKSEWYDAAESVLTKVQSLCNNRHLQAFCDAGDVCVAHAETIAMLSVSSPETAEALWVLLGRASVHYAAALNLEKNRAIVLLHLAENEWNRASLAAQVGKSAAVQQALLKNAGIYAERALLRFKASRSPSEEDDRRKAFQLCCDALDALNMRTELRRIQSNGP